MLLGRTKRKIVLEVVHNMFDIVLEAPCKDLIFSLMFFGMLKISSQEVLCRRRLFGSETRSYDGVKNMIRVSMYKNQVIAVSGHIIIVVSFIAHPDGASFHGRDKKRVVGASEM